MQHSFRIGATTTQQSLTFNDGNAVTGTGHVCALQLHFRNGASLLKKKDMKKPGDADAILATSEWKPKPEEWYEVTQEVRGAEICVQISGGPTLYARHPRFATPKTRLSLGTWGGGKVSYDHIRIWNGEPNPYWPKTREQLSTKSAHKGR